MADGKRHSNPKTQALLRGLAFPAIVLPGLLALAGRLSYWQAWAYIGVNLVLLVVNYLILRDKPDLMEERLKAGEGTKWWASYRRGWPRLYSSRARPWRTGRSGGNCRGTRSTRDG